MDTCFECDYYFGRSKRDIRQMDTSFLRGRVVAVDNRGIGSGYYQPKVIRGSLNHRYDALLFLGETRCISTWIAVVLNRVLFPRRRIYFWSHGWYGKETRVERRLKRIFFRLANGGSFLYGYYARDLMIKEGFAPDKLFVIHNSLDYDRQCEIRRSLYPCNIYKDHFSNDSRNLFFVGRLTPVKQLDLVLRAVALAKDRGVRWNLTLIGDGEMRDALKKLSLDLGIEEQVWFYGPCYDEEMLGTMIYNADVCVSPGNVGLTAMHSMVFGTPVITHDDFTMQMPEYEAVREGETGCFFQRGDVVSLAETVNRWFGLPGYDREEIRRKCYAEIDHYWTPAFQMEVLKKHLV